MSTTQGLIYGVLGGIGMVGVSLLTFYLMQDFTYFW